MFIFRATLLFYEEVKDIMPVYIFAQRLQLTSVNTF
jgi:hypothetical protein